MAAADCKRIARTEEEEEEQDLYEERHEVQTVGPDTTGEEAASSKDEFVGMESDVRTILSPPPAPRFARAPRAPHPTRHPSRHAPPIESPARPADRGVDARAGGQKPAAQ